MFKMIAFNNECIMSMDIYLNMIYVLYEENKRTPEVFKVKEYNNHWLLLFSLLR